MCLSTLGTVNKDQHKVVDIFADILSTLATLTNLYSCTGKDELVYDYIEAFGQVFKPETKEKTTPRYKI